MKKFRFGTAENGYDSEARAMLREANEKWMDDGGTNEFQSPEGLDGCVERDRGVNYVRITAAFAEFVCREYPDCANAITSRS